MKKTRELRQTIVDLNVQLQKKNIEIDKLKKELSCQSQQQKAASQPCTSK